MSTESESVSRLRTAAIIHTLSKCSLFAGLDSASLEAVADVCVVKGLKKGETLFREGEESFGFYIVQNGAVNVHRIASDGKEQVICVFRPYECFAEVTLATVETYPANAVALQSSQVLLVRKNEFKRLILTNPDLSLRMLASMSLHLKHLVQMIEDLKFRDIETRLGHWLLRNIGSEDVADPNTVKIDITKRVLANQLGVTSETFSRTLGKFREKGYITVDGNSIKLLKPKELTEAIGLIV